MGEPCPAGPPLWPDAQVRVPGLAGRLCLSLASLPSYPENGVVTMKPQDVRARARTILPWQELEVGQVVMLNYNSDQPRERGFWYDAEICRKRETRAGRELYANVRLG